MGESKTKEKEYYWLKLPENFFEDDTIKFIREQENGDEYLIIYLMLCCKSLRSEGVIIRIVGNRLIPYEIKSLAEMTHSSFDTVRSAIDLFKHYGLIEILDSGAIQMAQINELVGKETDAARRKRKSRALHAAKKKSLESPEIPRLEGECDNVTTESHLSHSNVTQRRESRDQSSEFRDYSKERESRNVTKIAVGKYKNVFLSPDEFNEIKEEFPFTYVKQIENLSEKKRMYGYNYKDDYAALQRWQREDDWDYKEEFMKEESLAQGGII